MDLRHQVFQDIQISKYTKGAQLISNYNELIIFEKTKLKKMKRLKLENIILIQNFHSPPTYPVAYFYVPTMHDVELNMLKLL